MTTLPFPPRRSHLQGFWLGLHLVAFPVSALLAWRLGVERGAIVLAVLFAVTLAAGLKWADAALPVYRLWNRAGKTVARIGQWWTLAVTYYLVFTLAGRTGARLDLVPPSGSTWKPYGLGDDVGNGAREPRAGGLRRIARQAWSGQRAWWLSVLPCLAILSLFADDSRDEDVPSNIYTLY